jgi:hypothetical protein
MTERVKISRKRFFASFFRFGKKEEVKYKAVEKGRCIFTRENHISITTPN